MSRSDSPSFSRFASGVDRQEAASAQPLFSVLSGNPSEEELGALAVLVHCLSSCQQQTDTSALALWQRRLNRGQRLGASLRPGPGSWRRARPM